MRIAVFPFARPTFDVPFAEDVARRAVDALRAAGAEVVGDAALMMDAVPMEARLADMGAVDGVLILQASFCDAGMARALFGAIDVPLAIWAFPEDRTGGRLRLNSFCGLNLASHAVGLAGGAVGWAYQPADATPDLAALFAPGPVPSLRAASDPSPEEAGIALDALRGPVGLIGEHPAGFDTCAFDEAEIAERFGARVERIGLERFFDAARAVAPDRVSALRTQTVARLKGVEALDPGPLEKALRSYAALSDLADEKALSGIAVRCWPETFTEYGCAVCGAMARLNDEGVPASCEADMLGTLGSRLMQEIAGGPSMLTDIVDMDAQGDTVVLWHCGLAPLSMQDPEGTAEATLHSNRVKPLLNQFALKPGTVTFARLSQARGQRFLAFGTGEMIRAPRPFSGTAGTLRPVAGAAALRRALIDGAMEHHLSIVYGDARGGLESVAARLDMPVLDLDALA